MKKASADSQCPMYSVADFCHPQSYGLRVTYKLIICMCVFSHHSVIGRYHRYWLLIGRMLRRICVGAYCLFCPRDTHMLLKICVGAYAAHRQTGVGWIYSVHFKLS